MKAKRPPVAVTLAPVLPANREPLELALGELLRANPGAKYVGIVMHFDVGIADAVMLVRAEKPHRKPARRPSPRKSR